MAGTGTDLPLGPGIRTLLLLGLACGLIYNAGFKGLEPTEGLNSFCLGLWFGLSMAITWKVIKLFLGFSES